VAEAVYRTRRRTDALDAVLRRARVATEYPKPLIHRINPNAMATHRRAGLQASGTLTATGLALGTLGVTVLGPWAWIPAILAGGALLVYLSLPWDQRRGWGPRSQTLALIASLATTVSAIAQVVAVVAGAIWLVIVVVTFVLKVIFWTAVVVIPVWLLSVIFTGQRR